MADTPQQVKNFPFSGKLVTAADPAMIGTNFRELKNMRYSLAGIKAVAGMTKINTTPLATYLKTRSACHFRKTFPATESHIIAQAFNTGLTASQVFDNETTPPTAGDFGTAIHTDTSGASVGAFSMAPAGMMAYCNGKESLVWGGDENICAGFINFDLAGTFSQDYTAKVDNSSTTEYATAQNSAATIDAATMLLLHLDNNVTDSSPTTAHTVTNSGMVYGTTYKKFGTHAGAFDGTDKLTVPDNADFDFSDGTFTIDTWAYLISSLAVRPLFYQANAGGDYIKLFVTATGAVQLSIFEVAGGVDVVTVATAAGVVGLNRWYHIEVVENGDNFYIFVDGSLVATTVDTSRAKNYDQVVNIGFDGTNYFLGYLDEYRVSNTARHTAPFTAPAAAYTTSATTAYFYVGALLPVNSIKFYIGTANTSASAMTVEYWDGTAWVSCASISDGTAVAGVSLAQTGSVSFTDTSSAAKVKNIDLKTVYWYRVGISVVDATTTVYMVTTGAVMQTPKDIWDGSFRTVLSALSTTTALSTDVSINLYDEDYVSGNTASYLGMNSFATSSYLVLGFTERQSGLFFVVVTGNASVSALTVSYWNGAAWAAVTGLSDGTSVSGKAFNKSGVVTWNQVPSAVEFVKAESRGASLYYYKVNFSAALDASVTIDKASGIPAQEEIPGYRFPFLGQNRLWLCGRGDKDANSARCTSIGTSAVFNGDDTASISFGDNRALTGGCSLYTQFGSSLYDIMVFFKENETWIVSGSGPSDWRTFQAGESIGCVAPQTLATAHIPQASVEGVNRQIAIFQSADGIYLFDGRIFTRISEDIGNFFDPNASDTMNAAKKGSSSGFYDESLQEYHWLFASGSSTTLNREFVYSFKYAKWFEIERASDLQCGLKVYDSAGSSYCYGFMDNGYMQRLEYGNTSDGSSIVTSVWFGDVMPADSAAVETSLQQFSMAAVAKSGVTVNGTYYVDTVQATVGGTFTQLLTHSTKRVVFPTNDLPRQKGVAHSFKLSTTTSTEACGFEPLDASVLYRTERIHKNG